MADKNYNPYECRHSINFSNTFICQLQTIPCALHKDEKCYLQQQDEAIDNVIAFIETGSDTDE